MWFIYHICVCIESFAFLSYLIYRRRSGYFVFTVDFGSCTRDHCHRVNCKYMCTKLPFSALTLPIGHFSLQSWCRVFPNRESEWLSMTFHFTQMKLLYIYLFMCVNTFVSSELRVEFRPNLQIPIYIYYIFLSPLIMFFRLPSMRPMDFFSLQTNFPHCFHRWAVNGIIRGQNMIFIGRMNVDP